MWERSFCCEKERVLHGLGGEGMSAFERPQEYICERLYCKVRRTPRASAQHYCECSGLLHPLDSEKGEALTAELEKRMASSPRLRRIHGMTEVSKPRPTVYRLGVESTDYVPTHAIFRARHSTFA